MTQYWLTDEQVRDLTGKVRPSAQLRVLDAMGYSVKMRPDGTFVVPTDQFQPPAESSAQNNTYTLDFSELGNGTKAA